MQIGLLKDKRENLTSHLNLDAPDTEGIAYFKDWKLQVGASPKIVLNKNGSPKSDLL